MPRDDRLLLIDPNYLARSLPIRDAYSPRAAARGLIAAHYFISQVRFFPLPVRSEPVRGRPERQSHRNHSNGAIPLCLDCRNFAIVCRLNRSIECDSSKTLRPGPARLSRPFLEYPGDVASTTCGQFSDQIVNSE